MSVMYADPCCYHATLGTVLKWHGCEKGRALDDAEEIDYVVALIMGWIEGQLDKKVFFN